MATTNLALEKAFKGGMSALRVARKYRVSIRRVAEALRQGLRRRESQKK